MIRNTYVAHIIFVGIITCIVTISISAQSAFSSIGEQMGIRLPYESVQLDRKEITAEEGAAALKAAYKYQGVKYVWGGESVSGIDCSGLILAAYRSIIPGMKLQAWGEAVTTDACAMDMYYYNTKPLAYDELRQGDLIYLVTKSSKRPVSHVVMVKSVEKDVRGYSITFINATTRFMKVIEETRNTEDSDWKASFVGAGRLMRIVDATSVKP